MSAYILVRVTYMQIYLYNPGGIFVHEISSAVHILGRIRDEVDEICALYSWCAEFSSSWDSFCTHSLCIYNLHICILPQSSRHNCNLKIKINFHIFPKTTAFIRKQ